MNLCNPLCSSVCLSVRPARQKCCTLRANFQPFFNACHTYINFYYFIPLSVTMTLARGHKIRVKQRLLSLFSLTYLTDQDEILVVVKKLKLNI